MIRTKAYGFGIFYAGEKEQHPCIFFAGKSETESQMWMKSMRDVLKPPIFPSTITYSKVTIYYLYLFIINGIGILLFKCQIRGSYIINYNIYVSGGEVINTSPIPLRPYPSSFF